MLVHINLYIRSFVEKMIYSDDRKTLELNKDFVYATKLTIECCVVEEPWVYKLNFDHISFPLYNYEWKIALLKFSLFEIQDIINND